MNGVVRGIGHQRIGIGIPDAARAAENWFCFPFIANDFRPRCPGVKRAVLIGIFCCCCSRSVSRHSRRGWFDDGRGRGGGRADVRPVDSTKNGPAVAMAVAGTGHRRPASQAGGKITRALGSSSVGENVFVVGHGIHVVARFPVGFGIEHGAVDDGPVGDSSVIFSTEKGFLSRNYEVAPGLMDTEAR